MCVSRTFSLPKGQEEAGECFRQDRTLILENHAGYQGENGQGALRSSIIGWGPAHPLWVSMSSFAKWG